VITPGAPWGLVVQVVVVMVVPMGWCCDLGHNGLLQRCCAGAAGTSATTEVQSVLVVVTLERSPGSLRGWWEGWSALHTHLAPAADSTGGRCGCPAIPF